MRSSFIADPPQTGGDPIISAVASRLKEGTVASPASTRHAIAIGAMGALVVVGSFLPWEGLDSRSLLGTETLGMMTLLLGAFAMLGAVIGRDKPSRVIRLFVLGSLALSTFICVIMLRSRFPLLGGYYLTFGAAGVGTVLGVMWMTRRVADKAKPVPAPSTRAKGALVSSIVGLFFSLTPFILIFGVALGVIGMAAGIDALRATRRTETQSGGARSMAIAGIVLGAIDVGLSFLVASFI